MPVNFGKNKVIAFYFYADLCKLRYFVIAKFLQNLCKAYRDGDYTTGRVVFCAPYHKTLAPHIYRGAFNIQRALVKIYIFPLQCEGFLFASSSKKPYTGGGAIFGRHPLLVHALQPCNSLFWFKVFGLGFFLSRAPCALCGIFLQIIPVYSSGQH